MDWKVLFEGDRIEAQIIKGLLDTEGIPSFLEYEAVGKIYGFTVDGLGKVKVLVPLDRYDEARGLVESKYKNSDLD